MVIEVSARSAAEAYHEALWQLRVSGKHEPSRNGDVLTIRDIFVLSVQEPRRRVLLCPIRNANPFFHVMEVVWMFAGDDSVEWIMQFNSRLSKYANDGYIHGAYGHRWFTKWGNQVLHAAGQLIDSPTTRQAVIQMWDPVTDWLPNLNDRPCNTEIVFRMIEGGLDMTVFNRSNDLIWGMLGANIVHMTYLHEFVSIATGIPMGTYRVVSNNLHFYTDLYPNGKAIWDNIVEGPDPYPCQTFPFLSGADEAWEFQRGCQDFMRHRFEDLKSPWLKRVALPMYRAYKANTKQARLAHCQLIEASDWRRACEEWIERNHKGV